MTELTGPVRRAARMLSAVSVTAVAVTALVYMATVLTAQGQSEDVRAWYARLQPNQATASQLQGIVHLSAIVTAIAAVVILAFGWRSQRHVAVAMGVGLIGALATSATLLHTLGRPVVQPWRLGNVQLPTGNEYPGLIPTLITATVLMAVVLVPPGRRSLAAVIGATWLAAVCSLAVVGTLWLPSSAFGGMAVATAWCAGVTTWSLRRYGRDASDPPQPTRAAWLLLPTVGATLLALLITHALGMTAIARNTSAPWRLIDVCVLITLLSALLPGYLLTSLRCVALTPSTPEAVASGG